jgi:hypothetical protein
MKNADSVKNRRNEGADEADDEADATCEDVERDHCTVGA